MNEILLVYSLLFIRFWGQDAGRDGTPAIRDHDSKTLEIARELYKKLGVVNGVSQSHHPELPRNGRQL